MSRKTSIGQFVSEKEAPQACDLCGAFEETRPYGPNKEQVCFDCGMLDEDGAYAAFTQRLNGPAEPADA